MAAHWDEQTRAALTREKETDGELGFSLTADPPELRRGPRWVADSRKPCLLLLTRRSRKPSSRKEESGLPETSRKAVWGVELTTRPRGSSSDRSSRLAFRSPASSAVGARLWIVEGILRLRDVLNATVCLGRTARRVGCICQTVLPHMQLLPCASSDRSIVS